MTQKLLLALTLLVSLFLTSPALAAKSYRAERFDVQIDLQEDGSALITETIEFHFEGDPFTFVFREVDADETDGITFLEASMDGAAMPQGQGAGQVEIDPDDDTLEITWHFAETTGAHVFVLRYRADGVVRKGDADSLVWRAIPQDHDYNIARSSVSLTYPSRATLIEDPTLSRSFERASTETGVMLIATNIARDDDLILTARFAPGSLSQVTPAWQVRNEQADAAVSRAIPIGLFSGIAMLLLGGLGLFSYARANRRELATSPVIPNPAPPSNVPPAVVGKLSGKSHGFMGTVFDLAQRGVLEIREEKGALGTKNHILVRNATTIPLHPHERGLLDAIFKPAETTVKMHDIAARLATESKLFDEPLEQEMFERGWLDPQRKAQRTKLGALGAIAMMGSIALALASIILINVLLHDLFFVTLMAIVLGVSIAGFVLSIALLAYSSTVSPLTPLGEEQAARWNGFAEYLKQVSKGKEPAIRPDYFERYLPYAAAFGLGASWAKYFQSLGGVPLPVWFHATDGGSTGNFAAIIAVMSASDSSGAGGAGAGGAAGASGGGASGAG